MAPLGDFFSKLFEKLDPQAVPASALVMLEQALQRPLPPELAAPPPRPDVWGTRGYLAQPRYEALYKPLLVHGQVTRGIVYRYEFSNDDGCDAVADYVWLAGPGQLRTEHIRESYDGLHAAYGAGMGDIILDADAGLKQDKVLTILHDGNRHLVYEALRTGPDRDPAVLRARAEAAAEARRFAGPEPTEDWSKFDGRYLLRWKVEERGPVLCLEEESSGQPVCLIRPAASEPGEWWLYRKEPARDRPWLRLVPVKSPAGSSAAWRIVSEQGQEVGHARLRGEHLFVTARGKPLMLRLDGKGGWVAEDGMARQHRRCEQATSGEGQYLELRDFRVFDEVLLLALAAAGRPWSASP
jgi:hypothetical protein